MKPFLTAIALFTLVAMLGACGKSKQSLSSEQADEQVLVDAANKATGGQKTTVSTDQQLSAVIVKAFPGSSESDVSALTSQGKASLSTSSSSASRGIWVPTPFTPGYYRVNFNYHPYTGTVSVRSCSTTYGCHGCNIYACY